MIEAMRKGWDLTNAIIISAFMASCAGVPDVNYSYYGVQWSAVATATQTIGCSADNGILASQYTPTITPTFSSDYSQIRSIRIKDLSTWYANSDLTMDFYEDGRLKRVGQSTIGQGETYIKTAVSLASAIAAAALYADDHSDACRVINQLGNSKPITLTYKSDKLNSTTLGKPIVLNPTEGNEYLYSKLKAAGAVDELTVSAIPVAESLSTSSGSKDAVPNRTDAVNLTLQKTQSIQFTFKAGAKEFALSTSLIVPRTGADSTYTLPILKAALFGKQSFGITLYENGAIQSVSNGMEGGGAGLMNALGSVANAETATINAKAAELKAQADILSNQHRLVVCKTKPDDCK